MFLIGEVFHVTRSVPQLIKLLVFYDRASIIDVSLTKCKSNHNEPIILDVFEYALSIDKFKVLFFFVRKYNFYLFKNSTRVINSLCMNLAAYFDVNIREKSCGIMYLEEKLYLFEMMLNYFDYINASYFLKVIQILLNYSDDGEEVGPFGLLKTDGNPMRVQEEELDEGVILNKVEKPHHTKDNFLIHCANPLKIIVIILAIFKRLEKRFSLLKTENESIAQRLSEIAISIIETNKNADVLDILMSDTLYNGS